MLRKSTGVTVHKCLLETACLVHTAITGRSSWAYPSSIWSSTSCSPAFFPSPSGYCLLLISSLFPTCPKHPWIHPHTPAAYATFPSCFSPWHISKEQSTRPQQKPVGISSSVGLWSWQIVLIVVFFLAGRGAIPNVIFPLPPFSIEQVTFYLT